jgi:hypothetical protein
MGLPADPRQARLSAVGRPAAHHPADGRRRNRAAREVQRRAGVQPRGIVAAVRFRNTLDDSKDAVYVFLATAIGLASAVNLPVAAVISIGFNALALVMYYTDFGSAPVELDGASPSSGSSARASSPARAPSSPASTTRCSAT